MTMRTPLRQPETSDERLTAIETYLPHLATREDVIVTREYMERALREQSDRFREAMNDQSDKFHEAMNAQSDKFTALMLKQTADMQAQMRSDRRWTIGTVVTVGLAIAGLIIRMSG